MNEKSAPNSAFDYVRFDQHVRHMPPAALIEGMHKYTHLLQKNPRNGDLIFALGMLSAQAEQYDVALEHYKKALKRFPNAAPVLAKITEMLVSKQYRFKEAIPYYKKSMELGSQIRLLRSLF